MKGLIEELTASLHLRDVRYEPAEDPRFHPGRSARLRIGDRDVGVFGELHPRVKAGYELPEPPVVAADLAVEALLAAVPERYETRQVSRFPAVVEDLAVVVDEAVPSGDVERLIAQAGGRELQEARLFDLYRGEQIGAGKKSLAYRLTYQSDDATLTDKDAERIRGKILKRLQKELAAVLRG